MRRGLGWLAAIAGILTALFLRRRRPVAEPDPAEELRRTLAARREEAPAPPPVEEAEPAPPSADVAHRRREVHDQARAAIDEMRRET